ncbi:MAG: HAD-IIA family hydrolase [Muribaculaceae bacterium]|nr:HAD-IIA family hydrolase [Muribaculaceae bacterium]
MKDFDKYYSPMSEAQLKEACAKIKHVALDMDGTIYLGSTLFPYTLSFLKKLKDNGIGYSFLTNNPTKSVEDYLKKLRNMGIDATREEMNTSAVSTIDYIKIHHPEAKRLFVLGTPSMIAEFEASGFEITTDDANDVPHLLVVAFDTTLEYKRLCRAAWWASQGLPYIATNPDRVCPTDQQVILVDCGSICKAIEYATGRIPDIVIGKPNPGMLTVIQERYHLQADEIAMCGDRIYTDVKTAQNAGALGVLVLSGETTLETAMNSNPQPPITALNIEEFGKLLIKNNPNPNY